MTKADLHKLASTRSQTSRSTPAAILLRRAQDPVIAKLDAASFDDEPVTDADRKAINDAVREARVPWNEVSREFTSG